MKLHFTSDWLRKHIKNDPDVECEVGGCVTDPDLLAKLERASRHQLTADEIQAQRLSFVYGNLPADHPMTKGQVAEHLARMGGYDLPESQGGD